VGIVVGAWLIDGNECRAPFSDIRNTRKYTLLLTGTKCLIDQSADLAPEPFHFSFLERKWCFEGLREPENTIMGAVSCFGHWKVYLGWHPSLDISYHHN